MNKPGGATYACSCLFYALLMVPVGISLLCVFTGGIVSTNQDTYSQNIALFSSMPVMFLLTPVLAVIMGVLVMPPTRMQKFIRWFTRR